MNTKKIFADSPVVFVKAKRDLSGKLALVSTKESWIVAVVMGSDNAKSYEDITVSEYIVRELGNDVEKLYIDFYVDGLFVYGTLLPKYITPEGTIHTGWSNLGLYPWVKARVYGYKLLYNGLPYAVRSRHKSVLGVLYLGVSKSEEERIDSVELSAGYSKIETTGTIVENFPYSPIFKVRMYTYPKAKGISLPTMLFGEFFVAENFKSWYKRVKYHEFLVGNCSIIITAPHGGLFRPPKMKIRIPRYADENTFELSKLVVSKIYELSDRKLIPNAVLARIHRSIIDLNRSISMRYPIGKKYHETIARLIDGYKKVLLIDIHGMLDRESRDIEIGTLDGYTIHGDIGLVEVMRNIMRSYGLRVDIDVELTGQFTVINHSKKSNVYAVQIEVSRKLRLRKNLEKTSEILARAIIEGYNYLMST